MTREGIVLYANEQFRNMIGIPARHQSGQSNLDNFISAQSWISLHTALKEAMNQPMEGQLLVDTILDEPRTIRLSMSPFVKGKRVTIRILATEVTELIEKNKALRDTEASLHSLSARILQLQDAERRRIARDLHDITGQELAVVVMSLNHLANNLGKPGLNAREAITDSVALVRKVEEEIRTLSYVLHPPLLDELGLGSALHWYAEGFTKRSGVRVNVDDPTDLPRLSRDKEIALFRVVQESLDANVLQTLGQFYGSPSGFFRGWMRASVRGRQRQRSTKRFLISRCEPQNPARSRNIRDDGTPSATGRKSGSPFRKSWHKHRCRYTPRRNSAKVSRRNRAHGEQSPREITRLAGEH